MYKSIKFGMFFTPGFWEKQHLGPWITTIMVMLNIGLSYAILAGGIDRFSIPSYIPLIKYVHGHTWIWGIWIGLSGFLMSVPMRWPNIIGLWIGMFWHIIWMACFFIAASKYDTAAATAAPAYAAFAMICAALLTARVIDKT